MAERRIIKGWIYERGADGQIVPIGPAGGQAPAVRPVAGGPGANPMVPLEIEGKNLGNKKTESDIYNDSERLRLEREKFRADMKAKGFIPGPNGDWVKDPEANKPTQRQAASKNLSVDEILGAIDAARSNSSGWTTGLGSLLAPIPATDARDLAGDINTIASGLTLDKLGELKSNSPTGASGLGSLTEREGMLLRDSVASLDQGLSTDKFKANLDKIELHYRRYRALQDGRDPNDPDVQREYGIPVAGLAAPALGGSGGNSSGGSPGTPPQQLVQGGSKTVADPMRAGMNAKLAQMAKAGASAEEIRAFLRSAGIDPATVSNIDEVVRFRQQYPMYQGEYPVNVEVKQVPLGAMGNVLNKLGQSSLGAYAMQAADAVTAGNLARLTANPELTRAGMEQIGEDSPIASILGTMTGGALAAGGLQTGLARLGVKAIPAAMGADTLYGGAYGASVAEPGDGLLGAAKGAALGLGGGMVGRGAARGIGTIARGVSNPSVKALDKAGVRMSVGQIVGGRLKDLEDRLSGLPFAGGIINGQRKRGLEDFQRAAFREALTPIGGTVNDIGERGITQAQQAVSDGYSAALDGVMVQRDDVFDNMMPQILQQTAARPRVGPELVAGMNDITSPMFGPGGTLRGQDAQNVFQGLEQFKAGYRRASEPLYPTQVAPSVDAYKAQIEGLLQRQAPDVLPALTAANQANRGVSILGDAVIGARNKGGQFTPAGLMNARNANTVKFSGKRTAARGDGPLFDLARAGNDVLPGTIPDSGTAGRLALLGMLGGSYGLSDYGSQPEDQRDIGSSAQKALATAALLALGAKGIRPAAQKVLLGPRTPAMDRVGQLMIDYSKLGGGAAIPLLLQQ